MPICGHVRVFSPLQGALAVRPVQFEDGYFGDFKVLVLV